MSETQKIIEIEVLRYTPESDDEPHLQVFKVPSDFADSSTTQDEWDQIVFHKSEQLRAFWDERFAA